METQGSEGLKQIESALKQVQDATKASAAEVQTFQNALKAYLSTGASVSESLKALSQESSGMNANIRALAAGVNELTAASNQATVAVDATSAAHRRNVTEVTAVGGAIRTAFGEQSIRSVENFLAKTLGIGGVLQSLFPITGAIAFAEILGHVFEKIDPLDAATKKLAESTKRLDGEFAALERRLEGLQINELTEKFGKAAGQKLAAFYSDTNLAEDQARIRTLSHEIDEAKEKLANRSTAASLLSLFPALPAATEFANRAREAARADVSRLTGERDFITQKTVVDSRQTSDDRAKIAKDEIEEAKARAREADAAQRKITEDLRKNDAEELAEMKAAHERSVGEVIQYLQKRREIEGSLRPEDAARAGGKEGTFLQENPDRVREITTQLGGLYQERDKLIQRVAEAGRKLQDEEAKKAQKTLSDIENLADDADKILRQSQAKFTETLNAIDAAKAKGDEISQTGALGQQRSAVQRRVSLADPRNRVSAGIQGLQDEAAIDRQIADVRIADEQRILATKQAGTKDYIDQQNKILEVTLSTNQKIYDDNTRILQAIHAEREKELQSFKTGVGSVFDALVSGSSKSIANVFKGLALGQAKTIVENLAATEFDSIRNSIPRATAGTKAGGILSGTIFGPDQLAGATATNTAATVANTTAIQSWTAALSGGGVGGAGGIGSIFGGSTSNPFVFNANDPSSIQGSAPTGALAPDLIMTGKNKSSGFGLLGKVGGIAAAGGGAFAAFSDFRSGGAKNDIAGVGAGLGSAAGIAALIPGGQVAALGLGIASLATSFVASLFPDPKKIREEQVNRQLQEGKYYAPESISRQQDTSGNYVDFDARGNLRQSGFRAVPQVSQSYQFYKGGTAYDAPGSTLSPYSPNVTINIHANDASSFVDMARRSSSGLADVIADHVQGSEGRLSQAIAYRVAR